MPKCKTIINGMAGWNVLLSIDIKAAYNNFPIGPTCQPYCSIVTQDGVYIYQKMMFGFNMAPCHLQYAICDILNRPTHRSQDPTTPPTWTILALGVWT